MFSQRSLFLFWNISARCFDRSVRMTKPVSNPIRTVCSYFVCCSYIEHMFILTDMIVLASVPSPESPKYCRQIFHSEVIFLLVTNWLECRPGLLGPEKVFLFILCFAWTFMTTCFFYMTTRPISYRCLIDMRNQDLIQPQNLQNHLQLTSVSVDCPGQECRGLLNWVTVWLPTKYSYACASEECASKAF